MQENGLQRLLSGLLIILTRTIDWHILSDGNPNTHLKEEKSFFNTMSKKYKKQKNVIYEICNEPNGCDWKEIKSYATQVIKTIRKNDKNSIIIVGTPTWSQLGFDGTHNEVANSPIKGYKNESCSLLSSNTKKTSKWSTKDLSKAGKYIRSKYQARKKALGKQA